MTIHGTILDAKSVGRVVEDLCYHHGAQVKDVYTWEELTFPNGSVLKREKVQADEVEYRVHIYDDDKQRASREIRSYLDELLTSTE